MKNPLRLDGIFNAQIKSKILNGLNCIVGFPYQKDLSGEL